MKFFHPQIQLVREKILDAPDAFYLHIVTFCPRTCFRANGHSTNTEKLANGLYKVSINLVQDITLPDFPYITPVVHTLALGSIAFPGGEGEIEVTVLGTVIEESTAGTRGTDPKTKTKTGGPGTVSTTVYDEIARPIDPDRL